MCNKDIKNKKNVLILFIKKAVCFSMLFIMPIHAFGEYSFGDLGKTLKEKPEKSLNIKITDEMVINSLNFLKKQSTIQINTAKSKLTRCAGKDNKDSFLCKAALLVFNNRSLQADQILDDYIKNEIVPKEMQNAFDFFKNGTKFIEELIFFIESQPVDEFTISSYFLSDLLLKIDTDLLLPLFIVNRLVSDIPRALSFYKKSGVEKDVVIEKLCELEGFFLLLEKDLLRTVFNEKHDFLSDLKKQRIFTFVLHPEKTPQDRNTQEVTEVLDILKGFVIKSFDLNQTKKEKTELTKKITPFLGLLVQDKISADFLENPTDQKNTIVVELIDLLNVSFYENAQKDFKKYQNSLENNEDAIIVIGHDMQKERDPIGVINLLKEMTQKMIKEKRQTLNSFWFFQSRKKKQELIVKKLEQFEESLDKKLQVLKEQKESVLNTVKEILNFNLSFSLNIFAEIPGEK
jgi:hypothetical protein